MSSADLDIKYVDSHKLKIGGDCKPDVVFIPRGRNAASVMNIVTIGVLSVHSLSPAKQGELLSLCELVLKKQRFRKTLFSFLASSTSIMFFRSVSIDGKVKHSVYTAELPLDQQEALSNLSAILERSLSELGWIPPTTDPSRLELRCVLYDWSVLNDSQGSENIHCLHKF